ncbi:siroheme synthase CysG [Balneatrix alpica]|uniref:siroheme synthase CysG n=1 Tax=Balneatrix alpica TaxID=75684 RepID=UPI002739C7F2|nr:siroheme synthase CysG [Balneatrix alpica]
MATLPLFFVGEKCQALVIGGGPQAEAKLRPLLETGFRLKVLCPDLSPATAQLLADYPGVEIEQRHWREKDLDGIELLVVADVTDTEAEQLAALAHARHLPVNVVDRPALCTLMFPARIQRGPVQLAVGTGGKATLLATLLREELEQWLPLRLGWLAEALGDCKAEWQALLPSGAPRREWLRQLWNEARLGLPATAAEVKDWLRQRYPSSQQRQGMVVLVGAGPGDPELLTLKALRALQQADVIVYDRLVSAEVMALARADAQRVYVGKEQGLHSLPQEQINQLLVREAKQGRLVVRLKGGDPFIFGRGGEEMEELLAEGVNCSIIPGITSASGCATYAGIPLTHRDYAQSVTLVTGHLQEGELVLAWEALARPQQTLVFYMGLTALPTIASQLMAHGLPEDTPVALVQKGTWAEQRVLLTNLAKAEEESSAQGFKSPTLIIVGQVVRCSPQWLG